MQIMRTGQSSQHLGLSKNQECFNRRYCKQKKTLKQVLQKKRRHQDHENVPWVGDSWGCSMAAAGETWFSPHCTTSTYHRIPHQAPCPWKLQLLFSMSMWAGKHDKVHVTCLNFPNCRWLVCCILQAVDSIRATSSILEKLQLPLIAISWNQTPKHVGLE